MAFPISDIVPHFYGMPVLCTERRLQRIHVDFEDIIFFYRHQFAFTIN